jgi:hypothetical protein
VFMVFFPAEGLQRILAAKEAEGSVREEPAVST